ncbi:MAG: aldo/keto reductase [Defluviitaleaceae bacterium]|nr:aldo/keto reductase [Defluviitaleaceae bacterium]
MTEMIYRDFGKTGIQVPPLGFGCMRLPMTQTDSEPKVDDNLASPLLQKAVELGINFFDTHWFYCNYDSQRAVGEALSSVRDKVYISSKLHLMLVNKTEDFDEYLKRSLELLGTSYLDFYHFPALSYKTWQDKVLGLKLIDRAENAKAKGLIRHISFSFHSDADKMHELIDTDVFSTVLGQYSLVDRRSEEVFAYAKEKGLGTMVMGPLMGGVLTDGGKGFLERMGSNISTAAEMGLRFAWSLPTVDMVLSGISDITQLEENAAYAKRAGDIPKEERAALIDRSQALKELNDLYCTSCNYCAGCPENIRIGRIFQLYIQHKVWGLSDTVKKQLANPGPFGPGGDPANCTFCGDCVRKCPQKIDIPEELKRVWAVLAGL